MMGMKGNISMFSGSQDFLNDFMALEAVIMLKISNSTIDMDMDNIEG